mmetsp:Transcript_12811/g.39386  ORF Transcript_12811/g.39386 Transcript_12811/m.39386 type:complete len:520 (-) Transcript_12811:1265-2824(-)
MSDVKKEDGQDGGQGSFVVDRVGTQAVPKRASDKRRKRRSSSKQATAGNREKALAKKQRKTEYVRQLEEEVFGKDPLADVSDGEDEEGGARAEKSSARSKAPAWHDDDDEQVVVSVTRDKRLRKLRQTTADDALRGEEYTERLRGLHRRLAGVSGTWAQLPSSRRHVDEDGAEDVGSQSSNEALERFKTSTQTLAAEGSTRELVPGIIEIKRLRNVNWNSPCRSVVSALNFHPRRPLLLVGGLDKVLSIYQVHGDEHVRERSIFFKDLPIQTAQFTRAGEEVIVSGDRNFFYQYDVVTGKAKKVLTLVETGERKLRKFAADPESQNLAFLGSNGRVFLLSALTKQKVGFVKMNAPVLDATFCKGGRELLTVGVGGSVYRWDVRMRRCVERKQDAGCVRGTAIAVSADNRLTASASDAGVVNLYDSKTWRLRKPIMNLTTAVHEVMFSSDGELMAFYSRHAKNAFRIVHCRTGSVYQNWPTEKTNLRRVFSSAFSSGNGFLAVGNDKGAVGLFRLFHYSP